MRHEIFRAAEFRDNPAAVFLARKQFHMHPIRCDQEILEKRFQRAVLFGFSAAIVSSSGRREDFDYQGGIG